MEISIISFFAILIATIMNICIIVILVCSKKYAPMLEPLDSEKFPLKDTYGLGLKLLELKKENYRSKWFAKQAEYLDILYEKKYVPYYLRIYCAKRLTMAVLTCSIMLCMASLSGEKASVMLLLALLLTWAVYKNYSDELELQIQERSDQMTAQLPEVVNRLALLINAGMILPEAWETVAVSGEGILYQEMRIALGNMHNGISESDAIFVFGRRSENNEVRKFASQLIQSIDKGGDRLSDELAQMSREMVELKRQYVSRKTNAASSKLMIPMFIMFAGVLILIVAPIMINL